MRRRDASLAVLVRAPVGAVYGVLTDVDDWAAWWPGAATSRADAADASAVGGGGAVDVPGEADRHRLILPSGRRGLRCRAAVHGWRHDVGARVVLHGGVDAAAEWWLEPVDGGIVVHLLVTARGQRADAVVRALGTGLQALKDHLELVVEVAAGRAP